jgi:hypothetical protein
MSTDSHDNSGILTEIEAYTGVCCVSHLSLSLSIYQKRPEERGKEGEWEGRDWVRRGGGRETENKSVTLW